MGQDTLSHGLFQKPYKILLYVDSMGCTSCKLRMPEWKKIIQETDSIAPDQVGFLVFFYPRSIKELDYMLMRDQFDYPVFVDEHNEIDKKNQFPKEMSFQCFLLDENNKVLVVGNPSINPQIWELYKQKILGKKMVNKASPNTLIEISQSEMEISGLELEKVFVATFRLTNKGNIPLIIKDIKSSCGCTLPQWDKSPIKSGDETQIRVEIKPDEIGYFHKTVDVYCNVEEQVLQLSIKGNVK
ncbi:MAG: DUF1573 domain-containing protein [Dysgonamonadaceae bacterium]|nr:DUF1573 domain-containing protein [Dysgonamonadaceae bacterium]